MNAEGLLDYGLPLFEGVTTADLEDIDILAHEQKLGAWQTVFDQQDESFDLYFLLEGALLAVFWTPEGREIVFSRFPIGTYFGELAALDGTPRSLAVFAKTDARILSLKRQSLLDIFDKVPLVRNRMVQHLVGQIRTLTLRSMEMTTMSVEQRVGSYLLRLAAEQGKLENGAIIEGAPTHSEIAGSIGANREMVSRSISKFVKRGAIKSSRQRIEILDPEILSEN
ncbi:Crp/Fnr family transcriptional regulator [Yoonia sediminilitoris]|uniref:CRP-like cAMP-binding protein n=1 Tax=Yoonia sediminilitoris TaxID=1286148 RepID=A0A2T6KM48_9RHOB|nr:Crp/Fnr family transcriptional regulator [Yoonia sediminilitoris]PUB17292.1 CRP-like cAMP-binding protein [Yoonia sediminilitoris]RCW97587.1 CRP-like cAMP-binding protein [Yoonia sediminilitoris]